MYTDQELETMWSELTNIPFDEDNNRELHLSEDWRHFKDGTEREQIWKWFDQQHSKGVVYLMYNI